MPTTSRFLLSIFSSNTFGADPPRSHFSPSASAPHQVTDGGWLPHARCHGSWPTTRYDQRGSPVARSKATIDFQKAPGCSHASLKPPGAAALQASTLAGLRYAWPNVPYTSPSSSSTDGGANIVAPA